MIFFGSSSYTIPVIATLNKNHNLKLVITTEKQATEPVLNYCKLRKISYLSVSNLSDPSIIDKLKTVNSPFAVLADFGLIIPVNILNIFPQGILNIHPSLLPKYRGPSPVQSAILNGEKETGITIIKLDKQVDHGPILAQEKQPIFPKDTAQTLYKRLFEKGAVMINPVIQIIETKGSIPEVSQNHSEATFTNLLTRQDGYIDLENPPLKEQLDRMIRAYYPWPGVWGKLKVESGPPAVESGKLKIIKFLPEGKIQVEGKKPTSYKDFLNGYPEFVSFARLKHLVQSLIL